MTRTFFPDLGPSRVRIDTSCDVIVVGGGLAGLSCAVALADQGRTVVLLEGERELGGRARSWRHLPSGDDVDIGPHVVHSEYANFFAFLARLGTQACVLWQPDRMITVSTPRGLHRLRHRALPTPFSLMPDMLRAPGLEPRDALSNMRITRAALRYSEDDLPRLDCRTGLEVLRDYRVSERMIDWFWRLASMTVMNVPLERCSAAALMRVHSQLSGHRKLHFGFPTVGLSDLYVMQAADVIARAGGSVRTGIAVTRVDSDSDWHVATLADGTRLQSRQVVLAVPPRELAQLRPDLGDSAFEPSPYKCVYLWFDRRFAPERFWTLLWHPDRLNYDFYDLAQIRPRVSGGASLIASNIIFSHRAAALSDDEIVSATLRELAEAVPDSRDARLLHGDVHHVPMAIPCPYVGTESRRPQTRTHMRGLFLAGDWTRTRLPCSMESAVRSGFLAAEACLSQSGEVTDIAIAPRPNDGLARLMQR